MRTSVGLVAVALVTALAACGGGGDSADDVELVPPTPSEEVPGYGGFSEIDSCALVTVEEVAQAVDAEITESMALPTGCRWVVDGRPDLSYEWQEVAAEAVDAARELGEGEGYELVEIDGLGEEAFLRTRVVEEGPPQLSSVWVRTGDTAFLTGSTLPPDDAVASAQEALAELLVDRVG